MSSQSKLPWKRGRAIHPIKSNQRCTIRSTLCLHSSISNTTVMTNNDTSEGIQGLLDRRTFRRFQSLHNTIRNLQNHLPTLLESPISSDIASQTYADGIKLLLNGTSSIRNSTTLVYVLSTGLDELMALSTVLAATNQAASRVTKMLETSFLGRFLSNTVDSSSSIAEDKGLGKITQCDLYMNEASIEQLYEEKGTLEIFVLWSARTPFAWPSLSDARSSFTGQDSTKASFVNIMGLSELILDTESSLVTEHRIRALQIDGRDVLSAARIAESIATSLRENIQLFVSRNEWIQSIINSTTPSLTSGGSKTISSLNDLRDRVFTQIQQQRLTLLGSQTKKQSMIAPLYIARNISLLNLNRTNDAIDSSEPIDLYEPTVMTSRGNVSFLPLPGTEKWEEYASVFNMLTSFCELGVFRLVSGEDIHSMFDRDATFEASNGNLLLSGSTPDGYNRVANIYQTLSTMRSRTYGDWSLLSLEVTDWSSMKCIVSWSTKKPVAIQGRDEFTLTRVNGFESGGEPMYRIVKVKQLSLNVRNTPIRDAEWLRSIIVAIEGMSSSISLIPGNSVLSDLIFKPLGPSFASTAMKIRNTKRRDEGPPILTERASAAVYGVMTALYVDLNNIFESDNVVPASEYLSDAVELRGLINEVLVKGKTSYGRVWLVATNTMKTLLGTGQVHLDIAPTTISVGLTAEGRIRAQMMMKIRIDPSLPKYFLNFQDTNDAKSSHRKGITVTLELLSEYRIDEAGEIDDHRLIESKINGRLTPGDVLSRWILGNNDSTTKSTPDLGLSTVFELLKWIQDAARYYE